VTNVHVTDIGADYVRVTWDNLAPPAGNHVVKYDARCVNMDADRPLTTDDNHTESTLSSSYALSVLTSRTNATFLKLAVGAKYLIKVSYLLFLIVCISHSLHSTTAEKGEFKGQERCKE